MEAVWWLFKHYALLGIDKPANHEEIADFLANDVKETAHPVHWNSGDISIAFRRFLEKDHE
jgi:hypothetical protein